MNLGLTWQNGVEDAEDQPSKIEGFLTTIGKLRNAESHKDVVGIEKWTKHLEQKQKVGLHKRKCTINTPPLDSSRRVTAAANTSQNNLFYIAANKLP